MISKPFFKALVSQAQLLSQQKTIQLFSSFHSASVNTNPTKPESLRWLMEDFKQNQRKSKPLISAQQEKHRGRLTVVLEMDEVLFSAFVADEHETASVPNREEDFYFESPEIDMFMSLYKRPHLDTFLEYLRQNTEPILFTRGLKTYTNTVLNFIDPLNTFVHVLTHEDCAKIEYAPRNIIASVKDLENLNRDMRRLVYIDTKNNTMMTDFWSAPDNVLPINTTYYPELLMDDRQLLQLIQTLDSLDTQADVRVELAKQFNTRQALVKEGLL